MHRRWIVAALLGVSPLFALLARAQAPAEAPAAAPAEPPYTQTQNVVFAEVDGIGLVMDVFTPKAGKNGLAIVDVASGYWHSDRGKVNDHIKAGFYDIFCGRGYTVFAVRPGSLSKYTGDSMGSAFP